ncbi:hypothetical protein ACH4Q6_16290 [Streptomyces lydicus]|uniref:hypothetical protein n=1 Tax=Streptomyces lydicus TaxID=47763 RepID=UPI0037A3C547
MTANGVVGYELSTDPDRLDVELVHHWPSTYAFWALGRSLDTIRRAVRDHLAPYRLKRVLLSTLDAHEVYSKAGFVPFPHPENLMLLNPPQGSDTQQN